jgi:hypothetical protein
MTSFRLPFGTVFTANLTPDRDADLMSDPLAPPTWIAGRVR